MNDMVQPPDIKAQDERVALLIDLERCTGCKSCEAACKTEHRLGPGEYRNKVVWASALEAAGLCYVSGPVITVPEEARIMLRTVAQCFDARSPASAPQRHAKAV